jgi:2-methylcitrate dehydratase PrpD
LSSTSRLARFTLNELDVLPGDVIETAKLILADTVACMVGGSTTAAARDLAEVVDFLGGKPQATLVGMGKRADLVQAVYLNAYMSDILDFEDTFVSHPSSGVIPAALAAGEMVNCSGMDLLRAIVAGFEVSMRVGLAIRPSGPMAQPSAGVYYFHCFGSTAAAGRLMKLSEDQLEQAFGTAAAHAPLPLWIAKWSRPLHWVKNNCGGQAAAGIMGVLLARTGFVGVADVLDHPLGFWRMVGSDRYDAEVATAGLGADWMILRDTLKPYPCCRWLHSTLTALQEIMSEASLSGASAVEAVTVRSPNHLANFMHFNPKTLVDAEFSLPYVVAQLLRGIKPGCEWFTEANMRSPEADRLARKVRVIVDPELEAFYRANGTYSVSVTLAANDGRSFERRVDYPKGDTKNPMTVEEVAGKFMTLVTPVFGEDRSQALWQAIRTVERQKEVRPLVDSLAGPTG